MPRNYLTNSSITEFLSFCKLFSIKPFIMTKKGFTLIELLVVVAIIGLLAMVVSNFDFNKKTDIEKQHRFTQKIESMIHSTLLSSSSGRGIKSGVAIVNPTSTQIEFSTGSIGVYYYSGTSIIGTWEVINNPFFGDSWYVLSDIYGKNKDSSTGTIGSFPLKIIFNENDISFTGTESSYVGISMNVKYHGTQNLLEFDRRFWKIQ